MKAYQLSLFLIFYFLIIGCESKFVEKSPDTVDLTQLSLNERLQYKKRIDEKLNEINNSANKLKNILSIFKNSLELDPVEKFYSPLDLILDVNEELTNRLPTKSKENLSVNTFVNLPHLALLKNCENIQVKLESEYVYSKNNLTNTSQENSPQAIGESLKYYFKSCHSKNSDLLVYEAKWLHSQFLFKFHNENIKTIFENLFFDQLLKESSCQFDLDDKNILDTIHCESLKVKISNTKYALIQSLVFSNSKNTRLKFDSELFENEVKIATPQITIFSNKEPKIELNKIPNSVKNFKGH